MELLKKYGFESMENIKVVDQVNGFSVGWTLGYLINELNNENYLPKEDLPRKLSLVPFLLLASLIALVIIALLVILIAYIVKRRKAAAARLPPPRNV